MNGRLRKMGGVSTAAMLVMALAAPHALGRPAETVTICHAAGPEDHVTLNLPTPAVFGPAGHLNEDGIGRIGHEGDYLGECETSETTTTEAATSSTIDPTTTTVPVDSTTTTVPVESTTTTSVPVDSTTTTVPVESTTTTTTDPGNTESSRRVSATSSSGGTTTTTIPFDVAAVVPGGDDLGSGVAEELPKPTPTAQEQAVVAAAEELPFTGSNLGPALPAALLMVLGLLAVYVTRGFGRGSGAHLSTESNHFGLGLRRGRHESV